MKILNCYAGLGGNRKYWNNEHEVTAIENDPEIAKIYKTYFPNDTLIINDAHEYLLNNFENYDFIWSSPPCPSHSKMNTLLYNFKDSKRKKFVYPDMRLYQEIILLQYWFKGNYVIENVISYYNPLIIPQEIDRHYFWSNFIISNFNLEEKISIKGSLSKDISEFYGFNISNYKGEQRKDRILRNCVHPELGLHILNCAITKGYVNDNDIQESLF